MPLLLTPRTIVDTITLDDASFFVQLLNTPGWLEFIGDRGVTTISEARSFLTRGFLATYREHGFGYYLVRDVEGQPFAICGFLKKPHLQNPDFGFAQLPEYCGRGLAHEYARAILDYGSQVFKLDIVDAEVVSSNARSIRLLQALGFDHQPHGKANAPTALFQWHRATE